MTVGELDTPALIIDIDVMERNLRQMADYAAAHNLRLRPHTKTHKTPALGRRQLELGATGLTVAKPGEAEVMLDAEPRDLLVAFPTVGRAKLARLMEVAGRTRLSMSLDSLEAASALSEAAAAAGRKIGVLTEIDVGLGRVGVAPGPDLDRLIEFVDRAPGLVWDGLAFYPGHIKSLDEAGLSAIAQLSEMLENVLSRLAQHGFQPKVVSGGSTPTGEHSHRISGMNEIRPGTYIFNDRNSASIGSCRSEDCAASIVVTVVSTAKKGQVIVDGGSKTFSSDRLATGGEGFGAVKDMPEAIFTRMNEEHGFVDVSACKKAPRVGERLEIVPNHICVAVNLHERIYGVNGDRVEEVWIVEGRGKLQ